MNRTLLLPILFTIAFSITALNANAEPKRYTPDKWHTRILFSIDHMGLSKYSGRFIEHEIDFVFDEENMENSSVEVNVPISSIDTFSPELNSKMGSESFFHGEQHPAMHFKSTKVERTGARTANMHGDLTIKGTTLPITFYVTYNNNVMHPRFKLANVGFTATAKVDSRAYGVNSLPVWMVGSMVDVRIEMEAFEGDKVPYYSD